MESANVENKYYYNLSGKLSLDEAVADFQKKLVETPDLKFVVLVNGRNLIATDENEILNIVKRLQSNKLSTDNIRIAALDEERRYSAEEWTQFKRVSELLQNQNVSFGFEDMGATWTIKEAEIANEKIRETSSSIQRKNYSPYEKLLSAYFTVTSRPYIEESENEHYSISRSIYGVLNSDKIVCVGFSELFKAIIEDIGDENIKIFNNSIATSAGGTEIRGFHQNLIVQVKDEKYGIDGFYYLDPTWDHTQKKGAIGPLNFFMIPLQDIFELKGDEVVNRIRIYDANSQYTLPKTNGSSNTSEPQKLINEPSSQELSFGKGGFSYTEEFLISMASDPKLKRKMIDIVFGNSVLNTLNNIIDDQKSIKIYKQALSFMSKQGNLDFSYEDVRAFNKSLGEAIEKDDINIFISVINDISQKKPQVNQEEEFIANIRSNLEKTIYEFDTEEEIAVKKEKISSITSSIEKLLEDPSNKLKLAQMPPQIKRYLCERAFTAMDGNWNYYVEDIQDRLGYVDLVSPVTDLQQRLSKREKGLEKALATLDELDSLSPEMIAKEISSRRDAAVNKAIEGLLIETSQTIELSKMTSAIRNVLEHDYDWGDELDSTLDFILETNRERASRCFTPQATNAFSQNPLTYDDEISLS